MPLSFLIMGLVITLAVTHSLEPDHIVTMRMMNSPKDYLAFGASHGVGFAIIAIPLILLFNHFQFYGILAGDIIAIIFAIVLIYGELIGKEFEISPKGSGVLQGAFAITPSKVVVAVLASETTLLIGIVYVALFILVSTIAMFVVGVSLHYVPEKLERVINIGIALVTIAYVIYTMINGEL